MLSDTNSDMQEGVTVARGERFPNGKGRDDQDAEDREEGLSPRSGTSPGAGGAAPRRGTGARVGGERVGDRASARRDEGADLPAARSVKSALVCARRAHKYAGASRRHYSWHVSGGGSVALVDDAAESVAAGKLTCTGLPTEPAGIGVTRKADRCICEYSARACGVSAGAGATPHANAWLHTILAPQAVPARRPSACAPLRRLRSR